MHKDTGMNVGVLTPSVYFCLNGSEIRFLNLVIVSNQRYLFILCFKAVFILIALKMCVEAAART